MGDVVDVSRLGGFCKRGCRSCCWLVQSGGIGARGEGTHAVVISSVVVATSNSCNDTSNKYIYITAFVRFYMK